MKKLILVRHAKSSWNHNVIDHERPLNEKGLNDAEFISNQLINENLHVDLVLSSDAFRAKTTAEIFINNLNISPDIFSLDYYLYDFSGEQLIDKIKSVGDNIDYLMLFGHNHSITHFVNLFGDIHIDNVPTCGVVILEFEIKSWDNLTKGKIIKTYFPRDFN